MSEVWTLLAMKEHFEQRFLDNQREVDKALAAVKNETKLALDASKEAIVKAEAKQDSYNESHNDLIRKAERLADLTMPRKEIEAQIVSAREHVDEVAKALYERLTLLERVANQGRGGADAVEQAKQNGYRLVGALIAAAVLIVALVFQLVRVME